MVTPVETLRAINNAHITIRKGWLTLAIPGSGSAAFKLDQPEADRNNEVDRFAEALKAALRGEKF